MALSPYTRASSAYSAVIQLYAHSHQLPTNVPLVAHFNDRLMLCWFGCQSIEDDHHLFVHCPFFDKVQHEFTCNLISDSSRILSDKSLPTPITSHLEHIVGHLFSFSEMTIAGPWLLCTFIWDSYLTSYLNPSPPKPLHLSPCALLLAWAIVITPQPFILLHVFGVL
jgi:hypothetical protein